MALYFNSTLGTAASCFKAASALVAFPQSETIILTFTPRAAARRIAPSSLS
jgi:hypothetical protein